MTQQRKASRRTTSGRVAGPDPAPIDRSRPLSARSIVASTLLGVEPPRLPGQLLVRSGELFGISEGTTRVAMSRMVAAGELEGADGHYSLAGRLLARHARQRSSRGGGQRAWTDGWTMAVVVADRRDPAARAHLREAMRQLDLAELREGVWLRPDNLASSRAPDASAVVADQCRWFRSTFGDEDPVAFAARLWDLDGWAATARQLRRDLGSWIDPIESGDTDALAPAFVVSAAVLRHLLADPLLPAVLLPSSWPGTELRRDYDGFDAAFKRLWRDWFRSQSD